MGKWFRFLTLYVQEVEYMLKCRHENIVHYYTSFVVRDELWVVMNLLSGGSVYDIIKHRMKQGDGMDTPKAH